MNKLKTAGFSAVEVLVVVVLVGIIGFVGWKVYDNGKTSNTATTAPTQQDDVPAVNSASDLDKAEDYLNDQDIDKQLDTSEIDSTLEE